MNKLPLRGVIAPVFIALGIAAGFLDLWLDSDSLVRLSLGFLALGLVFARHTRHLLASARSLEGVSGLYFEDCNQAQQVTKRPTDFTGGYAAYAVDPSNAERLWDLSLKLIA